MKFCKDCNCCQVYPDQTPAYWCSAPLVDVVTGESAPRRVEAATMRLPGQDCGPDGKLWVAKP
jgi:hypothetical protein